MKANVKTSPNNESFIIEPIDFTVKSIKGLKMYLKNLNSGYIEDERIVIPLDNADTIELYHKIEKLFCDRFGCDLESDSSSSKVLSEAKSEEERFKEFSKKACEIRNNIIDEGELKLFLECIQKENFKRTLKPFQLLSAYHIAFSQNSCNFSVPGSGKTTTVLAAYAYLKYLKNKDKKVDKLMVVGPLSSFIAWKKEYKYCFGTNPVYIQVSGGVPDKVVEDALFQSDSDINLILVSYGSVNSKQELLTYFLKNNDCMVVLDEAHRIKNVNNGVQSMATLSLSPHAKSRVVLTGTPAPNGYVDLYNLYKFIWPAHNVIGYTPQQLINMTKNENDQRIYDLINKIEPFFIRIKKDDLSLPEPKFHDPIEVEMSALQREIYDAIAEMAVSRFESDDFSLYLKRAISIRLRQSASNPSLLVKAIDNYYDTFDGYSEEVAQEGVDVELNSNLIDMIERYILTEVPNKFVATADIIQSILSRNEKVIVWCEFIGTCEDFSGYLKERGIDNRILYGKTLPDERELIINQFTDTDTISDFNVIIANPHAVGESISLHMTCHNAIYMEMSFNAGTYMQSKDRIHRVGLQSDDQINYYFIHSENTVDDVVLNRVLKKETKMINVIENQEIPLISDNQDFEEDFEDDIKAIIRGYYEYRKKVL